MGCCVSTSKPEAPRPARKTSSKLHYEGHESGDVTAKGRSRLNIHNVTPSPSSTDRDVDGARKEPHIVLTARGPAACHTSKVSFDVDNNLSVIVSADATGDRFQTPSEYFCDAATAADYNHAYCRRHNIPSPTRPPENFEPDDDTISPDYLSWVRHIAPPAPPNSYPYFVTAPVEELHKNLYVDVFQLLMEEGMFFTSKQAKSQPPFEFLRPDELRAVIDFKLESDGVGHDSLLQIIKGVIKFQPHIGHPFFMEQGHSGLEPYSCISDLVASCTNSNNVLYIVSTVLTLLEIELIRAICKLVGYDLAGNGDGTVILPITPGECLANGYAMRMAVKQKLPWIKKQGLSSCKRPVFFVSHRSVYIHYKCAIFQGYGTDSVIPVQADQNGKMDVDELRWKINESIALGYIPCMVVATAGTNIVRAIDPLDKIANICEEFGLWFHVDGTWGAALLFSSTLKCKLKGIERSDSFVWSQHFVLSVPCTSTCLVTPARHKEKLTQYLGLGEGIVFSLMKTPMYDPRFDRSHNTVLSSRRPEMFKFWLMWKAKGTNGLGRHVDYIFKNAQFCLDEIKRREGFVPIMKQFEGTNICFLYVPEAFRALSSTSEAYREKVSKLTVAIRRSLLMHGIVSLSYNELPGKPTFLILGLHNSAVTRQDIVYVLDQIEHFGEVLSNPKHDRHHAYTN